VSLTVMKILGAIFIVAAIFDVWRGKTRFLQPVDREDQPLLFWAIVGVWAIVGFMMVMYEK